MDLYEFTRELPDGSGNWVWVQAQHANFHDAVMAAVAYVNLYGGRLVSIVNMSVLKRINNTRSYDEPQGKLL